MLSHLLIGSSSFRGEQPSGVNLTQSEDRPSSRTQAPTNQTSSANRWNSRNYPSETTPYTAILVTPASDEENNCTADSATRNTQIARTLSTRCVCICYSVATLCLLLC